MTSRPTARGSLRFAGGRSAENHIADINDIMRRAEWGDRDHGIIESLLDLGYGPGEAPEGAGDYE